MPIRRKPQPVGKRFGMLTLISEAPDRIVEYGLTKVIKRMSIVKCDCGKQYEVIYGNLINGGTKSCGCSSFKMGQSTMERNHAMRLEEHKALIPAISEARIEKLKKLTNIQMIENGLINNKLGMSWCSLMHERTREFLELTK